MRLVHFVGDFEPSVSSGIGAFASNLVLAQINRGENVAVVTPWGMTEGSSTIHGGHCMAWPLDGLGDARRPVSIALDSCDMLYWSARLTGSDEDVVVCHDIFSVPAAISYADLKQSPTIFMKHSYDGFSSREGVATQNSPTDALKHRLTELAVLRSNVTISVSRYLFELMQEHYSVPPGNHSVLHGAGFDKQTVESWAGATGLDECGRHHRIVFAGRLKSNKGWDIALEAVEGLGATNVELVIAGDGPDLPYILAAVERSRHGRKISYVGHLGKQQLCSLYGSASICVFPSREEAFGLAIAEALSLGCCVVAADVGGVGEQIEDGVNGILVLPGSAADLRRALDDLIENPNKIQLLGSAARVRSSKHTWVDVANGLSQVMHSIRRQPAGLADPGRKLSTQEVPSLNGAEVL